ncbi:phage protein Gp27 family protein, partial [Glaesserella parasuis]
GKIVMEMVKNIAFETSIRLGEQEGGIEPKDLALLSSALQRLEQAESLSYERERKIRKEVIEQAAKAVEESGTQAGLSLEDVTKMVKAVYGIE